MDNKTNINLKAFYENVYAKGEETYFSKFSDGKNKSETEDVVLKYMGSIVGKDIIDVGCGTGSLISKIAQLGPHKAWGIDYSENAIEIAKQKYNAQNLEFSNEDFMNWSLPVDIIISCGTFEHMDDPLSIMKKMANSLKPGGKIFLTCPHFYNIRGIVWVALQKLLNVPMSLTDVHSISPSDMLRWANIAGLKVSIIESFDYNRGNGEWMIRDMQDRLSKALRDAKLDTSNVQSLIEWLKDLVFYSETVNKSIKLEGATCLYSFELL
jgi:2-polyprenyl-6-hydroxyphenyl methylase/3-demethylubiquinone-9 3-methyltransferase